MEPHKLRSTLMILDGTGKFTKSFLVTKRELTEAEINFLIDEYFIEFCGVNSVGDKLYQVSHKGSQLWRK